MYTAVRGLSTFPFRDGPHIQVGYTPLFWGRGEDHPSEAARCKTEEKAGGAGSNDAEEWEWTGGYNTSRLVCCCWSFDYFFVPSCCPFLARKTYNREPLKWSTSGSEAGR